MLSSCLCCARTLLPDPSFLLGCSRPVPEGCQGPPEDPQEGALPRQGHEPVRLPSRVDLPARLDPVRRRRRRRPPQLQPRPEEGKGVRRAGLHHCADVGEQHGVARCGSDSSRYVLAPPLLLQRTSWHTWSSTCLRLFAFLFQSETLSSVSGRPTVGTPTCSRSTSPCALRRTPTTPTRPRTAPSSNRRGRKLSNRSPRRPREPRGRRLLSRDGSEEGSRWRFAFASWSFLYEVLLAAHFFYNDS